MCRDKGTSFGYFGVIIDRLYIKVLLNVSIVRERGSEIGMCFVNVLFGSILEKHTFLILVDLANANGGIIMVSLQIHLLRDGR